ncbi:hypothetical protein MG293_001026 [Ovis ammon polii]|uniref:Uncharacterized protein n=1 Tax=Ovis ammon polii TaxID=230172 RepID=A0AAD4YIX9_OVIAM|nr:hypothetical protein MG293_001026 [Ovis ammon polii]
MQFCLWVGKIPGEGNGNSIQYSCLENSMDCGAWSPNPEQEEEIDPNPESSSEETEPCSTPGTRGEREKHRKGQIWETVIHLILSLLSSSSDGKETEEKEQVHSVHFKVTSGISTAQNTLMSTEPETRAHSACISQMINQSLECGTCPRFHGHCGTIICSTAEKTRVTVTSEIFMDQLPAALSSAGWHRACGKRNRGQTSGSMTFPDSKGQIQTVANKEKEGLQRQERRFAPSLIPTEMNLLKRAQMMSSVWSELNTISSSYRNVLEILTFFRPQLTKFPAQEAGQNTNLCAPRS